MSHNPASLNNLSAKTGMSQAELARRVEGLADVKTGKIPALLALDAALAALSTGGAKSAADAFAAMAAQSAHPHTIEDPVHAFMHGAPHGGYAAEPPAPPSIGGPLALLEKAAKSGAVKMGEFCRGCQSQQQVVTPEGGAASGCAQNQPAAQLATSDAATPVTGVPQTSAPAGGPQPIRTQRASLTSSQQTLQNRMRGFGEPIANPTAPGGRLSEGLHTSRANDVQGELDAASRAIQFEKIKLEIQRMTECMNAVSNTMAAMHEQGMTAIRNTKA